jgi:hypothetical protein
MQQDRFSELQHGNSFPAGGREAAFPARGHGRRPINGSRNRRYPVNWFFTTAALSPRFLFYAAENGMPGTGLRKTAAAF